VNYTVNQSTLHYEAKGIRVFGENHVMLNQGIDLTAKTDWSGMGFGIEKLLANQLYQEFADNTRSLLMRLWREAGLSIPEEFLLEHYHTLVSSWEMHLNVLEKTKLLSTSEFPVSINHIEERISEICGEKLEVKNPYDGQSIFHFRIIRPSRNDNNPLHRDVWLEDYKDCINLYIPIAGSNELSSLILIPGSHRWPESKIERTVNGAIINDVKFNVPAVTAISVDYQAVRPDPQGNEVLIFSPYLIHGGAVNQNSDKTRISIEMRLWKK
jgi:hypothetical protein